MYVFGRQNDAERRKGRGTGRDNFHLVIHAPEVHKSQSRDGLKTQPPSDISHMGSRTPKTSTIKPIGRKVNRKLNYHSDVGCGHPKLLDLCPAPPHPQYCQTAMLTFTRGSEQYPGIAGWNCRGSDICVRCFKGSTFKYFKIVFRFQYPKAISIYITINSEYSWHYSF